jgi:catechol 2,3-dioxygenase-like lactoylglutathione lyase family enzyme
MSFAQNSPVTFVFTRDREKTRAFYKDILGLNLTEISAFADVFELNGATLRIVPIPDHVPSPHTVLGWEVADIHETARTLLDKGVQMQRYDGFDQDDLGIWSAPDRTARVAWFLDPEGNNLSISQH